MNCARAALRTLLLIALALYIGACTIAPKRAEPPAAPAAGTVLGSLQIDRAAGDRILALDPEHISGEQVRAVLAAAPAPRVLLLHGGIWPVHLAMTSFAEFLIGMGYPENRIRRDDSELDSVYSYSPYQDAEQLTGMIAWYYEHEGLRPMMVGHSQGGIQAVKVLYEFAGEYRSEIRVWNPHTDTAEDRTTIVDPLTGVMRPVVGLSVSYASAVGAGGVAFLLPNQWSMAHRLHTIPDTVDDFTGFTIAVDLVALTFPASRGAAQYRHNGTANVRNVVLPSHYNHVVVPVTRELATSEAMRDWINAYVPGRKEQLGTLPPGPSDNVLWAADVWYSIKKHWCLEAQRLIRAKRAALAAQ
jgi:hypothetical protein